MKRVLILLPLLMCFGCGGADARAWFIEPVDGATVSATFTIKFGVEGKDLVPAADTTRHDDDTAGHHHILVGAAGMADGQIIEPDDEGKTRFHYGDARTETQFELPVGTHTLTMQFADFEHRSYGSAMSDTITITVVEN